jgi:hypothetical protein
MCPHTTTCVCWGAENRGLVTRGYHASGLVTFRLLTNPLSGFCMCVLRGRDESSVGLACRALAQQPQAASAPRMRCIRQHTPPPPPVGLAGTGRIRSPPAPRHVQPYVCVLILLLDTTMYLHSNMHVSSYYCVYYYISVCADKQQQAEAAAAYETTAHATIYLASA